MAAEPSNPGIIILLVIAGLITFGATVAALDELEFSASMLLGVFAGIIAGGIAFAAFQGDAASRPMLWVAYALSIPTMGFLILQGTNDDDGLGTFFAMSVATWMAMPFALALTRKNNVAAQE